MPSFGHRYYGSALVMARKRSMAFSLDDDGSQHGGAVDDPSSRRQAPVEELGRNLAKR
jgi:hypothetical protein